MIEKLEKSQAEERFTSIDSWVRGEELPLAVEESANFNAYIEKLKSQADEASAAVTGADLQNQKLRAELVYAAAVYRDTRYVLAGRGRMEELGINNMYREAYQVGKEAATLEHKNK